MRRISALSALVALCSLPVPSSAQSDDLTSGIAPLSRPSAPGALRGMTLCLERSDDRSICVRTMVYLQRLLRSAGAQVVCRLPGDPPLAKSMALSARAHLVLQLESTSDDGPSRRVAVPELRTNKSKTDLHASLVRFVETRLGSCPREVTAESPVVRLGFRLRAADAPLDHREVAHGLFEAIVDWWRADSKAIGALHASVHGPAPAGSGGGQPFYRRFWPAPQPPSTAAEVAAMLRTWRKAYVVDATQVYLDVEVTRSDDGWVLRGATELPLLARAVRSLLKSAGITPLSGDLRLLPDETVGDQPFGIVTARAAQTWSKPGPASGSSLVDGAGQGEETEILHGEPLRILDRSGSRLLVHAASGYLGWVSSAAVRRCSASEFTAAIESATSGSKRGELVARTALKAMGTPYLFGGRGEDGIDCSGLVQTSWESQGVFLPRDSRMQVLVGKLVATARQPAPLRPGDLLFFTNGSGRISHVALSLGGSRFVHATPPEVTVGSLDPEDPWYTKTAERFCLAKRVAR